MAKKIVIDAGHGEFGLAQNQKVTMTVISARV